MEDNFNESQEFESPAAQTKGKKFRAWLDNFFYYYKWHTIIAALLVFTVTICSVQMCEKESYDVYIVYAGGYNVSKLKTDSNEAEFVTLSRSLARAASDYNEDGAVKVSIDTLFMLTADEIAKVNAELKEQGSDSEVQTSLVSENFKTMNDRMLYSEYYVCLMSEEIFKHYDAKAENMFTNLEKYVNAGTDVRYLEDNKCAIYLNSTGMKNLPVLNDLPSDTVITLRALSEISNTLNKEDNRENYRRSEEYIRAFVNS